MIKNRCRWLIVPSILSAGAVAFACSSSSGDDNEACSNGSCSGNDSGGSGNDATINPNDGGPPGDGSTGDGAVKVGGPPIMLGQHLKTPYALAVDSTYVYVGEDVIGGRVLRAPIAGGTMETLASGFSYAAAVASDSTNLYVGEGNGNVYRFPGTGSPDGGVPPHFLLGGASMTSIVLTPTHVYWGTGDFGHVINSYDLSTDAAANPPVFGGGYDQGISIDSTDMFWGNQYLGSVSTRSIVPDAGPQFDIVPEGSDTSNNQLTEVRPLNGVIYWGTSTFTSGGIYSFPIAPQLPPVSPKLLTANVMTPWHLYVDEKYVYWISNTAVCPGVQYIPLAGGTPITLVPAPDESIFSFIQDANYIYYTHGVDISDATLVRVTKPD